MPRLRTFNSALQFVFLHRFGVTVLIFFQFNTRHYIIGTKSGSVLIFLLLLINKNMEKQKKISTLQRFSNRWRYFLVVDNQSLFPNTEA